MKKIRGFTLLELLVTLAIIAILGAVAVPSMSGFLANSRAKTSSNDLVYSAMLARSEAINRNQVVYVQPLTSGSDWSGGWQVITAGGDILERYVPTDSFYAKSSLDGGANLDSAIITMPASAGSDEFNFGFRPNGRPIQSDFVVIFCDTNTSDDVSQRIFDLDFAGKGEITFGGGCDGLGI